MKTRCSTCKDSDLNDKPTIRGQNCKHLDHIVLALLLGMLALCKQSQQCVGFQFLAKLIKASADKIGYIIMVNLHHHGENHHGEQIFKALIVLRSEQK